MASRTNTSDSERHKSPAAYEKRGACTTDIMRGDGDALPRFKHIGMAPPADKTPAKMILADDANVCETNAQYMERVPAKAKMVLPRDYSAYGMKQKDASGAHECVTDRQDLASDCLDVKHSGIYMYVHTQTMYFCVCICLYVCLFVSV